MLMTDSQSYKCQGQLLATYWKTPWPRLSILVVRADFLSGMRAMGKFLFSQVMFRQKHQIHVSWFPG